MADIDTMLAEVKRLDAEATKGPWSYDMAEAVTHDGVKMPAADLRGANREWLGFVDHSADDTDQPPVENDAALITYYRTAAPLLAAEVERLLSVQEEILMSRKVANAEVERLRAEVAAATDHVRALVAAMTEWGSWEDGVPAAGRDSGCGTVGDVYDAARAYLAAKGAER